MRHFFRQFTKQDYIFFALCGVAYFLLIRQYIPCVEDFDYHFSKVTKEPIASFSDAVMSQARDYVSLNGRFIVHVLVQLFCSIWSVIPFYIISSLLCSLLLMSMTWWVRHQYGIFSSDKYMLAAGLLFAIPIIGMTFLGHIAFVINYLWGAAIYVFFLCIYFYLRDDHPKMAFWENVALFIFAFIAGAWQESFSIGIAGALFFYHIVRLKETRDTLFYYLLSFALGVCVEVFAPGNFARLRAISPMDADSTFSMINWLGEKIYNIKMLLKHCPAISLFTILLLLIPILQRKRTWLFLKENYFLLMPCIIMLIFGCFMAFSGEHQYVIIGLFSTILCVNLLVATFHPASAKTNNLISIVCTIIIFAVCIPSYYYRSLLYTANESFEKSIRNPIDSIALSTKIEHIDREVIANSIYRRYTNLYFIHYSYESIIYFRRYSSYLYSDGKVHKLVALPESKKQIVDHCCESNLLSPHVYNSPNLHYYIIRIPIEWDVTKVICQESTISSSLIDKVKDLIMRRKGKEKNNSTPIGYAENQDDFSRWFIDDKYRYVIRPKPINRTLSSVKIYHEE